MNRPTLSRAALAAILLLGCGSAAPEPEPEPTATGGGEPTEPTAATSPWDGASTERLVALVREQAAVRIREAAPDLDLAQLPAWVASPESAPPLGDRVCEQLNNLAIAAAAAREDALAAGLVRLVRARAQNRNNAFAGTTLLSELARRSAASEPQAAVRAVFAELPRNRFGGATVVFQLFQNEGQIEARLAQTRAQLLSLDTAVSALVYDTLFRSIVANREVFLAAIAEVRAGHDATPEPAAYAFGTVDLSRARDARVVRVAVWDTGVAGPLFESQLFTAPGVEGPAAHGVIADPTAGQTGLTFEPGAEVVREYGPFLRGIMDLRAGLASTEAAQRVLGLMRAAQDPAAVEHLEQNLDAVGEWAHGTHVAGILLAGIPQAEVAVFRSAWAGEARLYHHRGPTDAELAAERQNVEDIARFVREHRIRVVNASLGFSRDYVEDQLRHESARYTTDAEVRARADVIHRHRSASWRLVFEQCPDTLFVIAAGNSNRDIVEYGDVPASLTLPNVLVVGAVDRFGNWATFTNSNPTQVTVFDHGVEVDSVIPSGERVPLSGTSMASPNVANLAAKILSVHPVMTPAEVISLIHETGDPIAAPFYGRIANEVNALSRARRAERGQERRAR